MDEAQLNSTESWCTTQIRTIPFSFTWTIKNFSFVITEENYKLTSSYFSSGSASTDIKWHLSIQKCWEPDNKEYLLVGLCSSSATKCTVFAKYTILLFGNKNTRYTVVEQTTPVKLHGSVCCGENHKLFQLRNVFDNAKELLPNDKLKLFCEVKFTDSVLEMHSGQVLNVKSPLRQLLSRDFKELLKNQSMSDVKLVVNGETFNAHKVILAARSPVFAAMFSHKVLLESEKSEVKIQDVDKDVLREVLHFIYTGKTENLKDMARDVLVVADKYDLQGLKDECEIVLIDTISVENAAELLSLASFHNAIQLKAKILAFVRRNSGAILKTTGWRELIRNNSDLLNDVIDIFSQVIIK